MERICITGTGRAGTTFLVRLLTLLELDTGYSKKDILENKKYISKNCNSGLEHYSRTDPALIIKDPVMIKHPEYFIQKYNIKTVLLPIRNYKEAAKSREMHGKKEGGLWNANNEEEQISIYYSYIAETLLVLAKYDVELHILDFERMTKNPKYLYEKLHFLLDCKYEYFLTMFERAADISKP